MKAVVNLDVPDWQIGQNVTVYFPDTMVKHGVCGKDEIVRCKDCKKRYIDDDNGCPYCNECGRREFPPDDWFCADGERK